MSSLIEEALLGKMYDEPKEDDKNFIKKRCDYYKNGYLDISPSEKRFTTKHPYLATRFLIKETKQLKQLNLSMENPTDTGCNKTLLLVRP